MNFVLTPQMIDKISFAMEDQKEQYTVDVDTGELAPLSVLGDSFDEARHIRIPRWSPAEGFHLMESFVTTLRNPMQRQGLAEALAAGTGVFRAFKDALKKSKEIEKLWFHYKEKKLRSIIIDWYNVNRVARGLERLPEEPEETEDLVTSDFLFSWGEGGHEEEILSLDREAFFGLFPAESPERLQERYAEKRRGIPAPGTESAPVLVAEGPEGELAGFAWGLVEGGSVRIVQLTVSSDLRGIGLGEALLKRFLTDMRARGMERLTTELSGKSMRFSDFFQSMGFKPVYQLLECGLSDLPF